MQLGMQEVTVELIAPPAPIVEPVPPAPPPPPPPEPELREDEMAVKRKVVKKKPPEPPKPRPPIEQPVKPVENPAPQPPAAAPVTQARYDADYLNNPAPGYPPLSRRLGEEGRVLLRVQVSADGKPVNVEMKRSSGFPRLDEAAIKAAAKWRFVPARQGDSALTSWVEVPIQFSLQK
jgi:protein TonB